MTTTTTKHPRTQRLVYLTRYAYYAGRHYNACHDENTRVSRYWTNVPYGGGVTYARTNESIKHSGRACTLHKQFTTVNPHPDDDDDDPRPVTRFTLADDDPPHPDSRARPARTNQYTVVADDAAAERPWPAELDGDPPPRRRTTAAPKRDEREPSAR